MWRGCNRLKNSGERPGEIAWGKYLLLTYPFHLCNLSLHHKIILNHLKINAWNMWGGPVRGYGEEHGGRSHEDRFPHHISPLMMLIRPIPLPILGCQGHSLSYDLILYRLTDDLFTEGRLRRVTGGCIWGNYNYFDYRICEVIKCTK